MFFVFCLVIILDRVGDDDDLDDDRDDVPVTVFRKNIGTATVLPS